MKRLTDQEKHNIYQAYLNGETASELASSARRSLPTIKRVISEMESSHQDEEEAEQEPEGKSIEDYYELIIQAKDDHIASLEAVIKALTGVKQ